MTISASGILEKLASTITQSNDLEELVRPFLEILEEVTGLESTYLTRIDRGEGLQHIVFAHNTKTQRLNISEGLTVDWADTLCKRALDEHRPFSDDVSECWADSQAARDLGIRTYLSVPIRIGEGELFGTLCGASGARVHVSSESERLLALLAKLIARQLERDLLLEQLKKENIAYSRQALLDPLTGIPNRRALLQELKRSLANSLRSGQALNLAFIDLDGFKSINDQYGHDEGDRFLIQIAQRLTSNVRSGDFLARYGGDEFIVFGPVSETDPERARRAFRERLEQATVGTFDLNGESFFYQGASVGVVTSNNEDRDCEALVARGDHEMYRVKKSRR